MSHWIHFLFKKIKSIIIEFTNIEKEIYLINDVVDEALITGRIFLSGTLYYKRCIWSYENLFWGDSNFRYW